MKRIFTTLSAVVGLYYLSFAQLQLQNGGFEQWTGDNPNNWYHIEQLLSNFGLSADLVRKETTGVPQGTACVKLINQTVTVPGQGSIVLPGLISLGQLDFSQSQGIVWGKIPFAARPDTIKFYYKFETAGPDTNGFNFVFSKGGNDIGGSGSNSFFILPPAANFTQVAIPISYSSSQTPDSLSLVIISTLEEDATEGTQLLIDDIRFVYAGGGSVSLQDVLLSGSVRVYPNPASEGLHVNVPAEFIGYVIEIADLQGRVLLSASISDTHNTISLTNIPNGQYVTRIISKDKGIVRTESIQVAH
ncbi:MAG: T9SS type A sorting domain-containing protein [Chitinophagales bacterium]|nr:T9SS type A sorting domain-containing protein [Chitinophagales bacterium]MDW8418329.1 T9SS type A sorting domain-containing protein [Chitinophagales bacterium]